MKKKILYLHASAELYGADYVLLELIRRLDRSKFEPIVLLPVSGPLVTELQAIDVDVRVINFPVVRRQSFNLQGILEYVFLLIVSIVQILKICSRENIALVHTNTIAVWGGAIAAKLAGKPHVWQTMEIIVSPKFLWKVSSYLVGVLSDQVVTISDAVRTHLIQGFAGNAKKAMTVYHGVDSAIYNPDIDPAPVRSEFKIEDNLLIVGMVARINPWKGQECFLRSAEKVLKEISNVRFFVVGDVFANNHQYRDQMLALINELSLSDKVFVTCFRTDLPQVMSTFDIFVLPSILPEPNATVLLAAMGMGKPVIATEIGGTLETVVDGETGILVPPNSPDVMAKAIIEMLNNPEMRQRYGSAGRARQEAIFSISNYANQIQTFYDGLLKKKGSTNQQ